MTETCTQARPTTVRRPAPAGPPMYRVVVLDDDTTPFALVIVLLIRLFGHSEVGAFELTRQIHNQGKGTAGVYPVEIAEAKLAQLHAHARRNGAPLSGRLEPDEPPEDTN